MDRVTREMNLRIARELMGKPAMVPDEWIGNYSDSMQMAETVADALRRVGWLVLLKWIPEGFPFRGDVRDDCQFWAPCACELQWMGRLQKEPHGLRIVHRPWAFGDTMAEAVVKAAVSALDAMQREGVPVRPVRPEDE